MVVLVGGGVVTVVVLVGGGVVTVVVLVGGGVVTVVVLVGGGVVTVVVLVSGGNVVSSAIYYKGLNGTVSTVVAFSVPCTWKFFKYNLATLNVVEDDTGEE